MHDTVTGSADERWLWRCAGRRSRPDGYPPATQCRFSRKRRARPPRRWRSQRRATPASAPPSRTRSSRPANEVSVQLLRPITYIRRHIDPSWGDPLPLVTPPFLEYTSGTPSSRRLPLRSSPGWSASRRSPTTHATSEGCRCTASPPSPQRPRRRRSPGSTAASTSERRSGGASSRAAASVSAATRFRSGH